MLSKSIMFGNKSDLKFFKTSTGSPVGYSRFKGHKNDRGMYFPMARIHSCMKPKAKTRKTKHVCVVYSRTYGREMYGNIDIWPEDADNKINKDINKVVETIEDCEIIQETPIKETPFPTCPKSCLKGKSENGAIDTTGNKKLPTDDGKHVTITITDTTEEDDNPTAGDRLLHPNPDSPGSPPPEEGAWPVKRSHSVDSRDNPFLPGGNLSKEAEEILSKATIIRDTFILEKEAENETNIAHESTDEQIDKNVNDIENQSPVCETIFTEVVQKSQSALVNAESPDTRPKENGRVDISENSLAPGSVKMNDEDKDKKKQKKCCAVM